MKDDNQKHVSDVISEVNDLPKEQQQYIASKLEVYQYQGNLPHPDILKGYDEIDPGIAKVIIDNGIKESQHRREMNKAILQAQIKEQSRGQLLGFVLSVFVISAAVYLVTSGYTITGTILSGVTLVGLIGLFTGQNKE
ncbi:MAG: DUF2335 domain-containing protein [Aerococcus sp.]|nr:DUF2335 domain-containing protein [Aerococcus sp.]